MSTIDSWFKPKEEDYSKWDKYKYEGTEKFDIGMVYFEISKVGGIVTVERNIKKALEKLGHKVTHYYLSTNKTKLPDTVDFDYNDKIMGYLSDSMLKETVKALNTHDFLIFNPPCPTLTKAYTTRKWQEIFKQTTVPILVVTHDPFFERYYKWLLEVKDRIGAVLAIQKKGYIPFTKYFDNLYIINHLLDLENMGSYSDIKEDLAISTSQFRVWKCVDEFVRAVPQIKYATEVYNGGIEYHYMAGSLEKRKENYKTADGKWIWDVALEHGMKYPGFVEDITLPYKRAKAAINLSTGEKYGRKTFTGVYKSLDYVQLEAMKYGAVPIVKKCSVLPGLIGEENLVIVDEDRPVESVAEKINDVVGNFDDYKPMIKRNFKLLKEQFDAVENTKKIIGIYMEEFYEK